MLSVLALALSAPAALAQESSRQSDAEAARAAANAQGAPGARADIRVRGGDHESYGRIVFDWQDEVDYRVGTEGGDLHVAFSRRASFDTEPMMPALRDYVGRAAPGPHGYRIVFPMKGTYEIDDWRSGTKVVVDLKRVDSKLSAELADKAPNVRVRVGEHRKFSRLVFDWPRPVGYEVVQDSAAGEASVRFRRPARLDLSRYAQDPPPQVQALSPIVGPAASGVDLQIPEGARVKHFTDGPRVVVDVVTPDAAASADTPGVPAKTAAEGDAPAAPPRAAEAETSEPPAASDPGGETAAAPEPGPQAEPETQAAARTPAEPARGSKPAAAAEESKTQVEDRSPEDRSARPEAIQADAEPDAKARPDAKAGSQGSVDGRADASDQSEPLQLLPPPSKPTEGWPEAAPATAAAPPSAGAGGEDAAPAPSRYYTPERIARGVVPKPGETPPALDDAALELAWAGRTAAAFQHGGQVWLAFDGAAPEELDAELQATLPDLQAVQRDRARGHTLLHLQGAPFLRAAPRLQDGTWRVALQRAPAPPVQSIEMETGPEGTRARLPVAAPGPVLTLSDPASGGRLIVVPVATPGQGVALRRRFPEFTLLATHTGIAVRPHADYVRVTREDGAVVISGERQPLMLSAAAGRDGAASDSPADAGRGLLDLERWRRSDLGFVAAKQTLQGRVSDAPPAKRPLARLDLARFYFAHGMGVEALGALDLYARETPRKAEDPQVLLMRGASQMLAGDWPAAGRTLSDPALDGVAEALPWQAAYASLAGAHAGAAEAFSRAEPLLAPYPPTVRKQLRLWSARSRLALADTAGAEQDLAALRKLEPNPAEAAEADFLSARRQLMDGAPAKAEKLWRSAASGSHPPTRARARFVLGERALAAGEREPAEMIEELERLRFAWRGDEFEAVLLHRLAALYVQAGRYNRALAALRQAASHLPDSPQAQRATERMRTLFASLFLDGAADRMPPLKALALYESYRELTPAGPRGDEMIARLADRLVNVDLLTRAAKLLDGQVRHRLDGQARARTGARLAAIRLLDRTPQKALEALDVSASEELAPELVAKRRHLRARALAKLDEPQRALALLADDASETGLELAADIHSEQGDWDAAAAALQRLLPAPDQSEGLPEAEAQRVMRTAVAMTLAGDTDGLLGLSQRYAGAMAESRHADTFDLLDPSTGGGPVTVAKQLAEVQQAKAFMSSFRDRLEADSTTETQ